MSLSQSMAGRRTAQLHEDDADEESEDEACQVE